MLPSVVSILKSSCYKDCMENTTGEKSQKLIFVYNADSGKLSALFDAGHKIVSPETYKCNLCTLTHGSFTERKAWKAFRESVNLNLKFLRKQETVSFFNAAQD